MSLINVQYLKFSFFSAPPPKKKSFSFRIINFSSEREEPGSHGGGEWNEVEEKHIVLGLEVCAC